MELRNIFLLTIFVGVVVCFIIDFLSYRKQKRLLDNHVAYSMGISKVSQYVYEFTTEKYNKYKTEANESEKDNSPISPIGQNVLDIAALGANELNNSPFIIKDIKGSDYHVC